MCMELQDQKEMLWEQFMEMAYHDDAVSSLLPKLMESWEFYQFCKEDHWEHLEGIFENLVEYDIEGLCLDMKGTIERYTKRPS